MAVKTRTPSTNGRRTKTREKAVWGGAERRRSTLPGFKATAHDMQMAQQARRADDPRPEDTADEVEDIEVSAKTKKLVDGIRQPFAAFTTEFTALSKSRAALAPKFMRAYHAWSAETGGTFVDFVRELDPEVPEERDAYRAHASYQAADYLRRLQANGQREPVEGGGPKAESPMAVIGMLLASMAPVVDNMDEVYSIFQTKLHWSPQRVKRLQTLAADSPPLLTKEGQARKLKVAA